MKKEKQKPEEKRELDILSAVRAVNRRMPLDEAVKTYRLTLAQAGDLCEHVAARERIARGDWPALTPFERASISDFEDSLVIVSSSRPASRPAVRVDIQYLENAVCVEVRGGRRLWHCA